MVAKGKEQCRDISFSPKTIRGKKGIEEKEMAEKRREPQFKQRNSQRTSMPLKEGEKGKK